MAAFSLLITARPQVAPLEPGTCNRPCYLLSTGHPYGVTRNLGGAVSTTGCEELLSFGSRFVRIEDSVPCEFALHYLEQRIAGLVYVAVL